MDFPATVRSARRSVAASQRTLALRLGVSATTVANWESGRCLPSLQHLEEVLALQGRELSARVRPQPPSDALVRHLHLSLTSRLRLALGEHPNPYVRATGDAWRALLVLGRAGRAVLRPPVATGVWIPVEPCGRVQVVVHEPRKELAELPGADVVTTTDPPAPSLVPVTVEGPVRVWVLPPAELLAADVVQLDQAATLLAASDSRDDRDRRAPAHRDPNEWVEGARMQMTKNPKGSSGRGPSAVGPGGWVATSAGRRRCAARRGGGRRAQGKQIREHHDPHPLRRRAPAVSTVTRLPRRWRRTLM